MLQIWPPVRNFLVEIKEEIIKQIFELFKNNHDLLIILLLGLWALGLWFVFVGTLLAIFLV